MISYKWLRLFGSTALAVAIMFFSSLCLASRMGAQSTAPATTNSSLNSTATTTFLVAPSFPLGYAPSSVATGDLRRSGKLDLVIADYTSGKITVFLGAGQGSFASGVAYDAGPHPSAVVVADIDGSGKPGVLVSNETEGTISVLLGNSDGTLQPRQSYAVGFNPSFIATGDFNSDGNVDVAVAGKSGLAIFLNGGKSNLKKPFLYSLSKTPTAITTADFNNDGLADVALANADGTVSILLGNGAGSFRSLPDISVAVGSLSSIVSGDFNKDGKIDLVITQPAQKLVSVLLGNGDGTFAPPASYPVGNEPVSTLVADANGDGVADLIVINQGSNTFSVLTGNGDGSFKNSTDYIAGNTPVAAVAGDFYGNGHVDLAIIDYASQSVSLPLGVGDGTFKTARSYSAGQQPVSIASGNLNGDKIPGLVVANYCGSDISCNTAGSVAVFLADDNGVYRLSSMYNVGAGPVSVALADVNGDEKLDIVAVNRLDNTVSILPGVGDGTFRQAITFAVSGAPVAVAVGDFNKDGKPDLAVLEDCGAASCSQPGILEILLGAGDGSFQSAVSYPAGYSPSSLAVGDINGDENLDIIVASRCGKDASCQSSSTGTLLLGDGTGKFTQGPDIALGNSPASVALGNLSGLGVVDLVVSRSTDNTVAVLNGNGDGTFRAAVPYPVGNNPGSLVVADFNADGKADVAVANVNDSTVSILYGRGDGTLQAGSALAVGSGPASLTAVGRTNSRHASLATANGKIGSTTPGTEFTVLPNLQSDPPLTMFVLVAFPAPTSSVNAAVLLTATLTGVSPNAAPSGTVTFDSGGAALPDCVDVSVTQGVSPSLISTATCTTRTLLAGSDSLTAVYSGDSIYDTGVGETSPAVTEVVIPLTPTLSLLPSPASPSSVNTLITFTAKLTGVSLSPIPPTGAMDWKINGSVSPYCPQTAVNSSGQATCTTNALPVGTTNVVSATYSGDVNFVVSAQGNSANYTITKGTPTVSLTPSPASPQPVNTSVTFTATLGGATFTPIAPTGTVSFSAAGSSITGCLTQSVTQVGANYQATCTTSALAAGINISIIAAYSGDSNFNTAISASLPYTITSLLPTISLIPAPASPSALNTNVTFTASLAGVALTPIVPTGTITFALNGTTIVACTGTVNVAGVRACAIQNMPIGSNTITATYSGDPNFAVAAPGSAPYTITKATPTVSLTPSPASPSALNNNVTFTATLTAQVGSSFAPTAPAGTVAFSAGGTTITGCGTQPLAASGANYVATCTTTGLAAGSNIPIVAAYSGDSNFNTATSASLPYTITSASATIGMTPAPASPSALNTNVTFTASLAGVALTPVVPTGTMTFALNGTTVAACTGTVNSSGVRACAIQSMPAGSNTVTATYSGDANYIVTSPGTTPYTVTPLTATLGLTASPSSSTNVNVPVTFTAQLGGVALTPVAPSGKVNFTANGSTIAGCSAVAVGATGKATCSTSSLVAGSDPITATYSGDANFTVAAPATITQTVSALVAAVTVTPSSSSITTTQALSVTVAVSGGSGNPTPTGTVTLTSGSYTSAATTLTSGSATINVPAGALATATDTLTGSYSGDSNYSATTGTSSVTVTNPKFTIGGTAVSVSSGATTSNTSTITVTPSGGFTGSVALTASITSSPVGAQNLPTLSFGSTSPVGITDTAAKTATLSIFTTAATTAALAHPAPGLHWYAGGTTLAFGLIFGIGMPSLGRRSRKRLGSILFFLILAGGLVACAGGSKGGGGNPGTTPGTYTVTVTGTSGSTTATSTVTLTVR